MDKLKAIGGKNAVRNVLALFWSMYGAWYFNKISFTPIPESNQHTVDTVLGFLFGTAIGLTLGFFFTSSKSSEEKTEILSKNSEGK